MTGMEMATGWTDDSSIDRVTAVSLGLRAQWLHVQLNQPAMEIAVPRDRELLTMVATAAFGLAHSTLVDVQRRLGTTTPSAAGRWIDQMVASGWIEVVDGSDPNDPRIDVPRSVRERIAHHAAQLEQT